MISQMNVMQNAARLAMDHRAAKPRKRNSRYQVERRGMSWALAALAALMVAGVTALFF